MMRHVTNIFGSLLCILLVMGLARTAGAQDVSDHPGYIDFDALDKTFEAAPTLEVNLRGVLMEMAAAAAGESEPEISTLLEKIVAVQVRGFDAADEPLEAYLAYSRDLAGHLEARGWQTAVRVREDDERVDIMLNERAGGIAGLLVMLAGDEDERLFINIVGDIRPEQLATVGEAFDIDPLRSLD